MLYQIMMEKKKDQQDPVKINFLQVRLDNYAIMLMIMALSIQIAGIYNILESIK